MTAIDRDRARAAFKSYTDAYDATNPRIALKIEHTYHVAEACDAVAREQGWSSEDIDLAWLCGLLHDMGRFEQLRRWDTFKDAESMSHAALGIEVLLVGRAAGIADQHMRHERDCNVQGPLTAIFIVPTY